MILFLESDFKGCCNPAHIRPGTKVENAADVKARGTRYDLKTHCIRDHEFTPENTYWNEKAGQRYCRACLRINAEKTYQRKKAAA